MWRVDSRRCNSIDKSDVSILDTDIEEERVEVDCSITGGCGGGGGGKETLTTAAS